MFEKTRYRSLERTLVVDTRVREVTQFNNHVVRRQSHAVGVPTGEAYNSMSMIVGDTGAQLPATKGFLHIDTAYPLKIQIGDQHITVTGQLVLTGQLPPIVLVSEKQQSVNVVQY